MDSLPLLFPDFKRPAGNYQPQYLVNALVDKPYTDPWQCVWEISENGITGSVHQHPLASWDDFDDYLAPDPLKTDGTYPIDSNVLFKEIKAAKAAGQFTKGGLPHGHTFLRIQDICGYENFLFDMYDKNSEILKLIKMVEKFNYSYISKWLELEPDMISYPQRLMQPVRDKNIIIHMHSDGDIRTLVDDLIDMSLH